MKTPLVSVLIPTYNMAGFLKMAINSCINQTYEHLEIIVCDNASDDDTEKVVTAFDDSRITYYRHDTNKGAIANFNFGIKTVQGEYLKFLEADDWLENDAIAKQVNELLLDEKLGLVSSGKYFVNEHNFIVGEHVLKYVRSLSSPYQFSRFIFMGNEFGTPSDIMINLKVVSKNLIYFDSLYGTYLNDWDVWFRIASQHPVRILNEKLVFVRRHMGQMGSIQGFNNKDIIVNFQMLRKLNTSKILYYWGVIHFTNLFLLRSIKRCIKYGFNVSSRNYFNLTSTVLLDNSTPSLYRISLIYMLTGAPIIWLCKKIINTT